MKKNLLYLLTFVCCLGLFAACSDDDDDPEKPVVEEGWKELSKIYQGSVLTVKMGNDNAFEAIGNVDVKATSAEAATVKLNNLLPEAKTITIEGKLALVNKLYTVTGETKVNDCTIAINGNFDEDGNLALTCTRTMSADITGDLALLFTQVEVAEGVTAPYVPVHWKAVTDSEETNALLGAFGPMLGNLIAGKVSAVNVQLATDGMFDVNWTKVGETTPTGMPDMVKAMVKIYYTVQDGKLYVCLNKALLENDILMGVVGAMLPEGLKMDDIMKLFVDLGGFYGLPLSYTQTTEGATIFMMAQDQLKPVLEMITPIILPMIPDELKPMIEQILPALQGAKQLEIGLPFVKK